MVTGVGFLGAGWILRRGEAVSGLTTAAGIWAVAATGTAIAYGYWALGIAATAVVLVIYGLSWIGESLRSGPVDEPEPS